MNLRFLVLIQYFNELDNHYILTPKQFPVNMATGKYFSKTFDHFLVIKNNGKSWSKHLQDLVECFKLPLEISVDFYCLTSSETRLVRFFLQNYDFCRSYDLLWPSEGTRSNKTTIIENDDDLSELTSEYTDFPHETILEAHYTNRLKNSPSQISIRDVLAMKCYIKRFNYESQYESFQ